MLNETLKLELKKIHFDNIEKYKGISEYEFYLINLIGITVKGKKQSIFIKNIKQGKIKESLFCICDLTYEKYYENNSKKLKKVLNCSYLAMERKNGKEANKLKI